MFNSPRLCPVFNSIEKANPMNVRIGVIIILTGVLCVGCASPGVAPVASPSDGSLVIASPPADLRAYKDPQTGEFTEPPPVNPSTAPTERAFDHHSHQGLTAVPNTAVPGGGIKLDSQGRFRSHFVATKDADGKVSVRCLPEHEQSRH